MKKLTTADRLNQIMKIRGMKQVDILEACKPYCREYGVKLARNDLSQYISGKVSPGQDKLSILGMALGVNEVWLMGYDVPPGKDALIPEKDNITKCDLYEKCYRQECYQAVNLFLKLDMLDRGRVIGNMEEMLKDNKYKKTHQDRG